VFDTLLDYRYLKEFGRDVNDEPNERVQGILKIWEYQDQRERLEQRRAESKSKK
jgi:hypothetical protein